MGNKKYYWMAVDTDELELPQIVADTSKELADILGLSKHTIEVAAYRNVSGVGKGRKFIKVLRD